MYGINNILLGEASVISHINYVTSSAGAKTLFKAEMVALISSAEV